MVTIEDQGLSYVQYKADGLAVNFMLTFPYLREVDISVFLDGVLVSTDDWSFLSAGEIQMDTAPDVDALLTIKRTTEQTERLVDFQDGGQLSEETLDLDSNQMFYLSQEAIDTTNFNLAINSADSTIDAQNNKIINLAEGTDGHDAVNKDQLDAVEDKADAAVATANAAESTANAIAATANSALAAANAATVTADEALATANAIAATADQALLDSATAISTANAAQAELTDAQPAITAGVGTGVVDFDGLSINVVTSKFDVGAVDAWFADNETNPLAPTRMRVSFAAQTAISVTNLATHLVTYVGINSSGVVVQSTTPFTATQRRTIIVLGSVIHSNHITINAINNNPTVSYAPTNQLEDLMEGMGPFNMSGNVISANGANLNINKSAGQMFKRGSNYSTDARNPHQTTLAILTAPSTMRYRTQTGTETANTAVIDPTMYDLAGVATLIPAATRWSIQRVVVFQTNLIRIQYGQAHYATMADALAAIGTEAFVYEQNIRDQGLVIGYIVVRRNATDLSNTATCVFVQAPKFAGGSAGGVGTVPTLQGAYNNSTTPEILTDSTLGALTIRRGSAADTDNVFEIMNGAGTVVAYINGNGQITGSIVDPARLDLKKDTKANLDTYALTATNGQLCFATDTKQAYGVVDGVLRSVGGATGGLDTIFQLVGDESISDWSTGDNATFLGAGAISGTFVKNTTTPIQGLADYKYTQAAGSLNDYMASPSQFVDPRFRGKECSLTMQYSYNGSNNDIEVIFYDATNSAIIPSSVFIQAATNITTFSTNIVIPSTCAQIRIGLQTKVLNSGKILLFDSISMTDKNSWVIGNVANTTSKQSFVPVITTGTGTMTNYSATGIWYRVGEDMYIETKITFIGAPGTWSSPVVAIPSGYAIDFGKIITGADVGVANFNDLAINDYSGRVNISSTTTVSSFADTVTTHTGTVPVGNGNPTQAYPFTFASGDSINFKFKVPIVGWTASNPNLLTAPDTFSTDTAGLTYAGSGTYTLSTLANAPVGTYITFKYAINSNTRTQTTGVGAGDLRPTQTDSSMNQNGIQLFTRAYNAASTGELPTVVAIQIGKGMKGVTKDLYQTSGKLTSGYLDAVVESSTVRSGMYASYEEKTGVLLIDAGINQLSTTTSSGLRYSDNNFTGNGYLVVNASKNPALTGLNLGVVAARGVNTAGTSISNSGLVITVTYDATKTYDTHGALNAATGVFTCPPNQAGYYHLSGSVQFSQQTYAISNLIYCGIFKNGGLISGGQLNVIDRAAPYDVNSDSDTVIYLVPGDTVHFGASNNRTAGATTLQTAVGAVFFSITKLNVG